MKLIIDCAKGRQRSNREPIFIFITSLLLTTTPAGLTQEEAAPVQATPSPGQVSAPIKGLYFADQTT